MINARSETAATKPPFRDALNISEQRDGRMISAVFETKKEILVQMSESVNEIIAALQRFPKTQRNEAIRNLKEEVQVRDLNFGTTSDVANLIHGLLQRGEDAAWRRMGRCLQVFPLHYSGGLMYFGYRVDDNEFVWGLGFARNS